MQNKRFSSSPTVRGETYFSMNITCKVRYNSLQFSVVLHEDLCKVLLRFCIFVIKGTVFVIQVS